MIQSNPNGQNQVPPLFVLVQEAVSHRYTSEKGKRPSKRLIHADFKREIYFEVDCMHIQNGNY